MRLEYGLRALILIISLICLYGFGGAVVEKTREGNRHYHSGKYQEALSSYTEAKSLVSEGSENSLKIHFNIGDVLYSQGRYSEARKEFEQVLSSGSKDLKERAYYNIGNTYFREGVSAKDIELLKKAAENYRKALELNPDDEDAKYNLEVVRRHIKLEQQKPPQQSPSCPRSSGKEQKEKEKESDKGDKNEGERQKQASEGGANKEQKQVQERQEQRPQGGMTKEEAERILKALSQEEKEKMRELLNPQMMSIPSVDKDW